MFLADTSMENSVQESKWNNIEDDEKTSFTPFQTVIIASVFGLVVITSIFGNILVCVAVATEERLRKVGNYFLVSLAMADLLVSVLVMSFASVNDLLGHWIFGKSFCTVWISFDIMFSTASILNICAISVDRYMHIKLPFKYYSFMTTRTALAMIAIVWILSGLISFVPINLGWHKIVQSESFTMITPLLRTIEYSSTNDDASNLISSTIPILSHRYSSDTMNKAYKAPANDNDALKLFKNYHTPTPVFSLNLQPPTGSYDPHTDHKMSRNRSSDTFKCQMTLNATYAVLSSLVSFFIPCIIMLTIYALIFSAVRKRTQNARKGRLTFKSSSGSKKTAPVSESAYHIANQQAITDRKAAITLGIIMGVFLVCWLPFFLYNIITPIYPDIPSFPALPTTLTWLGYLNSVLNPIIYSIFNRDFREAFKYILFRRLFCRKRLRSRSNAYCQSKSAIRTGTFDRNGRYSRYQTLEGKKIFSGHSLVDFYSNSSTDTVKEKITPT